MAGCGWTSQSHRVAACNSGAYTNGNGILTAGTIIAIVSLAGIFTIDANEMNVAGIDFLRQRIQLWAIDSISAAAADLACSHILNLSLIAYRTNADYTYWSCSSKLIGYALYGRTGCGHCFGGSWIRTQGNAIGFRNHRTGTQSHCTRNIGLGILTKGCTSYSSSCVDAIQISRYRAITKCRTTITRTGTGTHGHRTCRNCITAYGDAVHAQCLRSNAHSHCTSIGTAVITDGYRIGHISFRGKIYVITQQNAVFSTGGGTTHYHIVAHSNNIGGIGNRIISAWCEDMAGIFNCAVGTAYRGVTQILRSLCKTHHGRFWCQIHIIPHTHNQGVAWVVKFINGTDDTCLS